MTEDLDFFYDSNIENIIKKEVKRIRSDISILYRITSYETACNELGIPIINRTPYEKLTIIIEALNEGWKPNFTNPNQNKCYNYFSIKNGEFVFYCTTYTYCRYGDMHVPSALYFKNEELAIYCKDNFFDLYKEYYML
jgi:hypothetical protein